MSNIKEQINDLQERIDNEQDLYVKACLERELQSLKDQLE